MSLLMQALKKAQRKEAEAIAGDADLALQSDAFDGVVALTPDDVMSGRVPPAPAFTLEPLEDESAGRPAGSVNQQVPALEPALPAPRELTLEDLAPPETVAAAPALTPAPAAAAAAQNPASGATASPAAPAHRGQTHQAAPSAQSAPPSGGAHGAAGKAQGAAARARAAAQAAAEQDQPRRDPARVRLAFLGAALALVAGTLAGVYWYALTSPGPGASLPPVPMPPPGATQGGPPVTVVAPASDQPDAAAGPAGQAGVASDTPPGTPAPSAPPSQTLRQTAGYAGLPPALPAAPGARQAGSRMPADEDLQHALQGQARTPARNELAAIPLNAAPANPQPMASNPPQPAPATPYAPPHAATPAPAAVDIQVQRGAIPLRISTALQDGYQAFLNGDYTTAAQHYAAALRQDPNNRDALLGNAAIAVRRNDSAAAASGYQRLLELNPSDPDAQAGLLALRPGDAAHSEMRLRDMLRRDPGAAPLEFALGNLYAQQGRWPDAQQAYFRAYSAMPDNADYAFNLAVGLDRLSQRKLALTYYQRALDLSRSGPAAFDRNAARERAEQLGNSLNGHQP